MQEVPKFNIALSARKNGNWFCYRELVKNIRKTEAKILMLEIYESAGKKERGLITQYTEEFLMASNLMEKTNQLASLEHSIKSKAKTQEVCHYITIRMKENIEEEWVAELVKKFKSSKKYRSPRCQFVNAESLKNIKPKDEKDEPSLLL